MADANDVSRKSTVLEMLQNGERRSPKGRTSTGCVLRDAVLFRTLENHARVLFRIYRILFIVSFVEISWKRRPIRGTIPPCVGRDANKSRAIAVVLRRSCVVCYDLEAHGFLVPVASRIQEMQICSGLLRPARSVYSLVSC